MKKFFLVGILIAVLPLPILAQMITNGPDISCMQTAVKKRDQNFIKNFNDYNKAITTALKKRSDMEVAAWKYDNSSLRQQAIQIARREFDGMYALASNQFNISRQATNNTFNVEQQICQMKGMSSSSRSSSIR